MISIDDLSQTNYTPADTFIQSVRSKYLTTDVANAERFDTMYREDIRFVSEWKKWMRWNGKKWEVQPDEAMLQFALKTVMEMYKIIPTIPNDTERTDFAEHVLKCESVHKIKSMLEMSKSYLLEKSDNFDKDPMCFVVDNGVINLNTLQLEPHDKKRLVTKMSPVVYDPNAKCPKFEHDLEKAFKGNKETIKFYQKAVGYSMTGSMKEQCFFIQWGNGANLKSTLCDVISYVMGDYSQEMKISTIQEKDRNNQGANPELAILAGARFVRTGENDDKFKLSEGLVKQITSGNDGKISCRKLFENDSSFVAEFKMWISTNHKPQIKGTDYAIWRRVKMIPFTYTIPANEKIPDYHKIIIDEEAPGVLNWMLEGVRLWKLEGLGTCPDVEEATNNFRTENDTILQFINEFCDIIKNEFVNSKLLYEKYVHDFCEENGESYLTNSEFKHKLEEKGFIYAQKNKSSCKGRFYFGLKLKDEFNNERLENQCLSHDVPPKNITSPREGITTKVVLNGGTSWDKDDKNESEIIENTHQHSVQELGKEIMKGLYTWKKPENINDAKKIAKNILRVYDPTHEEKTYDIIVDGAFKTIGWL